LAFFENIKVPECYQLIDTPRKLSWLIDQLSITKEFAYDIETNHPTIKNKEKKRWFRRNCKLYIAGLSFAWGRTSVQTPFKPGYAAYIPLYRTDDTEYWGSRQTAVVEAIKRILECPTPKVAQNGKFDSYHLKRILGINVKNFNFDTMLAHVLLDEECKESTHGLKSKYDEHGRKVTHGMSDQYLDIGTSAFKKDLDEALTYYDPGYRRYSKVPLDVIYPYGCADSDFTLALKFIFQERLEKEGTYSVFKNITMPLQYAIMKMELHGVPLDVERANSVFKEQKAIMDASAIQVHQIVGKEFDVGSNTVLGRVLFEDLGLEGGERNKNGWVVDAEALQKLNHPSIEHLLKYRRAQKIGSTFAESALALVEEVDNGIGWVHPNYNLLTVTGRLSCDEPNFTQLPRKENGGSIVKGMWQCKEDYVFIFMDFSQMELRVMSHVSGDPGWIDDYNKGYDKHSATAKRIWNLDCEIAEVGKKFKEFRTKAKTVNFGIAYGKSAYSLSTDLGMTVEEAEHFINVDYFGASPVLKGWIDYVHDFSEKNGHVSNIFGRIRHLPDAMIQLPAKMWWPQIKPDCYRWCAMPKELGFEEDPNELSEEMIKAQIKAKRLIKYNKCCDCKCLKSCFVNSEVRRLKKIKGEAMRQSVNTVIQGSAADMASLALVWISQDMVKHSVNAAPFVYIHDEIGCYTHKNDVERATEIMKHNMTTRLREVTQFRVPLEVDISCVSNWGSK